MTVVLVPSWRDLEINVMPEGTELCVVRRLV